MKFLRLKGVETTGKTTQKFRRGSFRPIEAPRVVLPNDWSEYKPKATKSMKPEKQSRWKRLIQWLKT